MMSRFGSGAFSYCSRILGETGPIAAGIVAGHDEQTG